MSIQYGGWMDRLGYEFNEAFGRPDNLLARLAPQSAGDPVLARAYLEERRRVIEAAGKQRPLIRIWDKNMKYMGNIAGELGASWEELMDDSGEFSCTIRRDNWLADYIIKNVRTVEDLHVTVDPMPSQRSWRTRWGGKITALSDKKNEDGSATFEIKAISNREHLKHILFAANPIFPPEVQLPKMWLLPANCRTGISVTLAINIMRLFFPLASIPTNIFNPGSWLGTNLADFSPLNWPIQVAFCNPLTDQSRFSILGSRWSNAHSVCAPLLKDAGCMIRAYTWLEEDEDSPHTELGVLGNVLKPSRSCVVLAVEDKSGITGPTGTLLDGVINMIAATADDMITESLVPFDKDHDGHTDPLFRKWFGVAPETPWVCWREHQYSGIISSEHTIHKAQARTIMTGGKSPGWVNQTQTFLIRYALSQLAQVINYGLGAYEQPGAEGLDNLYQGQLDDTLLAWMRWTDPRRALNMGAYAYQEHFEQGAGTGWTLAATTTLREGQWKTREYQSFKVTVRNGAPYVLWYDTVLGDRNTFEIGGILYTDQITAIKGSYSRTQPVRWELSVGDDSQEEDPMARGMRQIQTLWNAVGVLFGSDDLF